MFPFRLLSQPRAPVLQALNWASLDAYWLFLGGTPKNCALKPGTFTSLVVFLLQSCGKSLTRCSLRV